MGQFAWVLCLCCLHPASAADFNLTNLTINSQVDIPFDGVFLPAQIYYTGPCGDPGTFGCLNDGGGGTIGETASISGKWLVYSGSLGSLMEPATVANGVSVNEVITAQSLDNPDCGPSSGLKSGWKMKTISNDAAGLPETIALPIALPIALQ